MTDLEEEKTRLERSIPIEERWITYKRVQAMLGFKPKSRASFYAKMEQLKKEGVTVSRVGKEYLVDVITIHLWLLKNASD